MSFATQSAKRHALGRSFLTQEEKNAHVPWYRSRAYTLQREARARKVARKVEASTLRRLEREDLKNGITPEIAKARTIERTKELHPESLWFFERVWRWFKSFFSMTGN